jgi:hypothetical protein
MSIPLYYLAHYDVVDVRARSMRAGVVGAASRADAGAGGRHEGAAGRLDCQGLHHIHDLAGGPDRSHRLT